MISSRQQLETIAGNELDTYLEKGWYRMGQSIFTTQFLSFDAQIYTALWLRLSLENYTMRKSLRKIFNKVHNNFQVIVQPATFGLDKELLFQKYKKTFKGSFNSTVNAYMLDNTKKNLYNTLECLVYDGEKLIAFSYFDIGETAIASILGVYDNDYQKYSLGVFTMLQEITWCLENKMEFYYPGYCVPGYERFDYKCRVGEMEYFDYIKKQWFAYSDFKPEIALTEKLKYKLLSIHKHLEKFVNNGYLVFYRYYDMWFQQTESNNLYDHPLLLLYVINKKGYVLEYDFKTNIYRLSRIITFNLNFTVNEKIMQKQKVVELLSPLICEAVIFETTDEKEMAQEILLMLLLEE